MERYLVQACIEVSIISFGIEAMLVMHVNVYTI